MATRVTKHASPALLARGVRGVAGEPMEIVLHLPTAPALSAQGFGQDSAFPGPELAAGVRAMLISAEQRPEARLLLFAHADEKGDEVYNKRLSDRRASAIFALLTQDLAKLDQVAEDDRWGAAQYQTILNELGLGPLEVDGQAGPQTANATQMRCAAFSKLTTGGHFTVAHCDRVPIQS